jgi:hypothetical protein
MTTEQRYYIASLKHTGKEHEHITWWKSDHRGYTPVSERAGEYTAMEAADLNDGFDCIAVPVEAVKALQSPTPFYYRSNGEAHQFYDYAGAVVNNTRANWNRLIAAAMPGQKYKPKPEIHRKQRRSFALVGESP